MIPFMAQEANRKLHAYFCSLGARVLLASLLLLMLIVLQAHFSNPRFSASLVRISTAALAVELAPVGLYALLLLSIFYSLHNLGLSAGRSQAFSLILSMMILCVLELVNAAVNQLPFGLLIPEVDLGIVGCAIGYVSIQHWLYVSFTGWQEEE